MKARLVACDRIAEATAEFTFEVQAPFTFEAGQTCELTLPSPRYEDAEGSSRTFSIASSPSDAPRVTFATRLTGTAFKRSLLEAAIGLEIDLDGPFGSFGLHKNAAKPAVFLAGGIGITPFRSIIKDATEWRLPHGMTLFYSNRTPASAAFLPDLEVVAAAEPELPAGRDNHRPLARRAMESFGGPDGCLVPQAARPGLDRRHLLPGRPASPM